MPLLRLLLLALGLSGADALLPPSGASIEVREAFPPHEFRKSGSPRLLHVEVRVPSPSAHRSLSGGDFASLSRPASLHLPLVERLHASANTLALLPKRGDAFPNPSRGPPVIS